MTQRERVIEARAQEIFAREYEDDGTRWHAEFAARGAGVTKAGAGEGLRGEIRQRAERELIKEGLIDPV